MQTALWLLLSGTNNKKEQFSVNVVQTKVMNNNEDTKEIQAVL